MFHNRSICFSVLFFVWGCASFHNNGDEFRKDVLVTVAGRDIPAEEFIYVYEKNNFNNDSIYTERDIRNYLDLFINFKLKVQQAKSEGIDTTRSFIDEFETYQAELAKPYLLDTKETDSLAQHAYDRLQYFIHASHILARIPDSDDTLAAYRKIKDAQRQLHEGTDFNELAQRISDDPSAGRNGGDLGYFSALKMVYPFENAAYQTPVGEVSNIFRTQFGYHILKVHDKEPNKGKVKIAHIVVRKNTSDSVNSENKIHEIYDKLETGGDWNYLCRQFSDDERTRNSGGELNYFGQGQLPVQFKNFEKKAFDLEETGEIGGPVETPIGWHILKLIDKRPPEGYDELKDNLISQVSKGDRARYKEEVVIARLKEESGFTEHRKNFGRLAPFADSTILAGKWNPDLPDSLLQCRLFEIDQHPHLVEDFLKFLDIHAKKKSRISPGAYLTSQYEEYKKEKLFDFEKKRIAENNFDYRMLEKEYYEGLLLFEVMEKYVWGKSTEDSLKVRDYYERHRENYKWRERVRASIVSTDSASLLPELEKGLKKDTVQFFSQTIELEGDSITENLTEKIKRISIEFSKVPDSKVQLECNPTLINEQTISSIQNILTKNGISEDDVLIIENKELSLTLIFNLFSCSKKVLEYLYNNNSALTMNVKEGLFERQDHDVLSRIEWQTGIQKWKDRERFYFVRIDSVYGETAMDFKEVRGRVISDYQNELEKQWIDNLKIKYPVSINESVLNKTIKYFEKK